MRGRSERRDTCRAAVGVFCAASKPKWAKSVIDGSKLSGSYWRQKIEGPFSLSNDTYALPTGGHFVYDRRAGETMRRELIDLSSGAVMLSQPKALAVTVNAL